MIAEFAIVINSTKVFQPFFEAQSRLMPDLSVTFSDVLSFFSCKNIHTNINYFKFFCLLGVYYCINMILIALSTLLSAIVINLFKEKGKKVPVPRWILKVSHLS